MEGKQVAIFIGVLVLLLGGLYAMAVFTQPEPVGDRVLADPVTEEDQVKGNRSAEVEIVEYSDFQCPACQSHYPLVQAVVDHYGDDIAFAYRHFPLPQHSNARPAARASEAAGRQGAFWEMHDMIFERTEAWVQSNEADEVFVGFASELELDVEQFIDDMASDEIMQKIERDLDGGRRSGVGGTPTFFLNGEAIDNPRSFEEWEMLIESELGNR